MSIPEMERRLVAVLIADIVGYTRLMGDDEDAVMAAWWSYRDEITDPKIEKYHGRIVKHTGDGFLAEFPSVLDAAKCAMEIQTEIAVRNIGVADEKCVEFRIGLNLCDVVSDEEDIYGDGVNIAARVEALAESGGICITAPVYEQIRKKIAADFEDLGAKKLKHVDEPVQVYRVWPRNSSGDESGVAKPVPGYQIESSPVYRWTGMASVAVVLVGISIIVWQYMGN